MLALVPGPRRCVVQAACPEAPGGAGCHEDAVPRRPSVRRAARPRSAEDAAEGAAGRSEGDAPQDVGRGKAWRAAAGGLLAVDIRSARADSPTHVTASPDVQAEEFERHQGVKRWDHMESSDGGSDKSTEWRAEKGGGTLPWLAAIVFIAVIGTLPLIGTTSAAGLTKTHILESACLYTWLLGGLYLFTNVLIFQSPHFEHPRPLCLEETVYLYAQILTTVGYGDITPARPRGQLCVGLFVFTAVLLISTMIQDMVGVFRSRMEGTMDECDETEDRKNPRSEGSAMRKAFEPVIHCSIVFCCFVAGGAAFFVYYPGEGKTLAQGVYMSLITLSTVGFGAFTPSTHTGMVAGAYWMLCGCSSLMAVVTSRAAFALALKEHEIKLMQEKRDHTAWDRDPKALRHGSTHINMFSRSDSKKASLQLYGTSSPTPSPLHHGRRKEWGAGEG